MPSGDACLLDSNILLRISKNDDAHHAAISRALHGLVAQAGSVIPRRLWASSGTPQRARSTKTASA
jgi:hypothetical protein